MTTFEGLQDILEYSKSHPNAFFKSGSGSIFKVQSGSHPIEIVYGEGILPPFSVANGNDALIARNGLKVGQWRACGENVMIVQKADTDGVIAEMFDCKLHRIKHVSSPDYFDKSIILNAEAFLKSACGSLYRGSSPETEVEYTKWKYRLLSRAVAMGIATYSQLVEWLLVFESLCPLCKTRLPEDGGSPDCSAHGGCPLVSCGYGSAWYDFVQSKNERSWNNLVEKIEHLEQRNAAESLRIAQIASDRKICKGSWLLDGNVLIHWDGKDPKFYCAADDINSLCRCTVIDKVGAMQLGEVVSPIHYLKAQCRDIYLKSLRTSAASAAKEKYNLLDNAEKIGLIEIEDIRQLLTGDTCPLCKFFKKAGTLDCPDCPLGSCGAESEYGIFFRDSTRQNWQKLLDKINSIEEWR